MTRHVNHPMHMTGTSTNDSRSARARVIGTPLGYYASAWDYTHGPVRETAEQARADLHSLMDQIEPFAGSHAFPLACIAARVTA